MSEQTEAPEATEPDVVPAERFREVARHKKAAEDRVKKLEQDAADLRAQIEDREQAGLPELDKLQQRLKAAEDRAAAADAKAAEMETSALNLRKEGWVTAVARDLDFIDPEDALNPRHVKLDEIESREDAERVLKRVAKAKKHLIKAEQEERPNIGRVLRDGREDDGTTKTASRGDVSDPDFKRQLGEEMLGILRNPRG